MHMKMFLSLGPLLDWSATALELLHSQHKRYYHRHTTLHGATMTLAHMPTRALLLHGYRRRRARSFEDLSAKSTTIKVNSSRRTHSKQVLESCAEQMRKVDDCVKAWMVGEKERIKEKVCKTKKTSKKADNDDEKADNDDEKADNDDDLLPPVAEGVPNFREALTIAESRR